MLSIQSFYILLTNAQLLVDIILKIVIIFFGIQAILCLRPLKNVLKKKEKE